MVRVDDEEFHSLEEVRRSLYPGSVAAITGVLKTPSPENVGGDLAAQSLSAVRKIASRTEKKKRRPNAGNRKA